MHFNLIGTDAGFKAEWRVAVIVQQLEDNKKVRSKIFKASVVTPPKQEQRTYRKILQLPHDCDKHPK